MSHVQQKCVPKAFVGVIPKEAHKMLGCHKVVKNVVKLKHLLIWSLIIKSANAKRLGIS